jgi:5-(carboxyamino)imidazole ribonucleotide synthase
MSKTIGIVGGGQLGRMLTDAAHALGCRVIVLDPTENSPAIQVADEHVVAPYADAEATHELASRVDALTYELEAVNADVLQEIADSGTPVHPTPKTLSIIKDKLRQKRFLAERGIPVAPFQEILEKGDVEHAATEWGYPVILKSRSGGFDGRGNATVDSEAAIAAAIEKLEESALYAEGFVRFEKELAIVAARTTSGDIRVFPLVETEHKDHICHTVSMPAPVTPEIARKAHDLAEKVLGAFEGAGVLAIEMFLVGDEVLVNEIAPRVHNSGHLTIEANQTSQFEQHIRAITGMELGNTEMKVPAAVMVNILGDRTGAADPQGIDHAERIPGVNVHIYGKMETKPQRKMGHLTATAETLEAAREKAEKARALISI